MSILRLRKTKKLLDRQMLTTNSLRKTHYTLKKISLSHDDKNQLIIMKLNNVCNELSEKWNKRAD